MSVAALKREANTGKMRLEILERYGKSGEELPLKLRGVRRVLNSNSVALRIENTDGTVSSLFVDTGAKLVDYDGESLTVYDPAQRDLTDQERKILALWKDLENDYYAENPYGNAYWRRKEYFSHCPCPWLDGCDKVRGKRYLSNGKVQDNSIRGNQILKYKVIFES